MTERDTPRSGADADLLRTDASRAASAALMLRWAMILYVGTHLVRPLLYLIFDVWVSGSPAGPLLFGCDVLFWVTWPLAMAGIVAACRARRGRTTAWPQRVLISLFSIHLIWAMLVSVNDLIAPFAPPEEWVVAPSVMRIAAVVLWPLQLAAAFACARVALDLQERFARGLTTARRVHLLLWSKVALSVASLAIILLELFGEMDDIEADDLAGLFLDLRALAYTAYALSSLAWLLWLFVELVVARRRLKRLARRGRCLKCGYDLRGDPAAGCPECGWKREEAGT